VRNPNGLAPFQPGDLIEGELVTDEKIRGARLGRSLGTDETSAASFP
jgi:hypothetical protein